MTNSRLTLFPILLCLLLGACQSVKPTKVVFITGDNPDDVVEYVVSASDDGPSKQGVLDLAFDKYEEAFKNFQQALALAEKEERMDANGHFLAGVAAEKLGKLDIAQSYYEKAYRIEQKQEYLESNQRVREKQ